jgi:hypothetical protein
MTAKDALNRNQWSESDRQRFADRDILKSKKIQGKRFGGPKANEWEEDLWTS